MKLINTECPKCKGKIKISEDTKKAKCEYCGNEFLIDDEVKKVKHLMAGQIDEEQEFKNARANLKFKEYSKAYGIYYSLSERYADNKEVWLGLLRAITEDFTVKEYRAEAQKYYEKYTALATEKEIEKYKTKYEKYTSGFSEYEKLDVQNKNVDNGKDHIVLTMFGGLFGLHKFAQGKIGMGFLYLFTGGFFVIGWLYDCFIEVSSHPESKNKFYNCLAVYEIFVAIAYMDYNPFGSLFILISAILTITPISRKVWKKPTPSSKFIKLVLFIVGFIMCINSIPAYQKTWVSDDMDVKVNNLFNLTITTKEQVSENSKRTKKIEKSYDYDSVENDEEVILTTRDKKYSFRFDKNSKTFCLLEEKKCTINFEVD